ncbi:DELTA-actitoxin-Aeq1c-like isoform X2 [Mauremys reevesii]|uniref:DELTA-actitoxin-Aeq1c-like isoform X2 n=1 Tax=Mauremys reevesii TaxID=260615 RepID=UPI00193F8509|nr:DELTA-actitoxin-Aeq1c-like isoform X2 [Mauremys reevesii]
MSNIEDLIALMDVGRCVGIQITNNTRDVTLEYPRTYCFSGRARTDPVPQIPPGSSGSCLFVKTSYTARGSVGVLSYESDAFTLAIMFSNPFDRILYNTEFAIELFAGRKHFESMENLYHYMYSQGPLYKCESYRKVKLEVLDGQLEVTNEKIQVKATMSNQNKSIIKIQIEQKDPCPPYTASPGKWPNVPDKGAAGGK